MRKLAALVLLALAAGNVLGATSAEALANYQEETRHGLSMCRLKFTGHQLAEQSRQLGGSGSGNSDDEDYRGCLDQARAAGKRQLATVLVKVKGAGLKDALKSYQAAYLSALQGIPPGSEERKISYELRQQSLDTKMTEAWSRVEVEN